MKYKNSNQFNTVTLYFVNLIMYFDNLYTIKYNETAWKWDFKITLFCKFFKFKKFTINRNIIHKHQEKLQRNRQNTR